MNGGSVGRCSQLRGDRGVPASVKCIVNAWRDLSDRFCEL
jgi:hypothetical protein